MGKNLEVEVMPRETWLHALVCLFSVGASGSEDACNAAGTMCNQVLFAHDDGAHHTCKPSFPASIAVMCHAYHALSPLSSVTELSRVEAVARVGPNEVYNP